MRPEWAVGARRISSFHVFGGTGLAASVVVAAVLAARRGLPSVDLAIVVGTAVGVFLALAMATKVVVGEERLTYYHHEIAVLTVLAAVLHVTDRPVAAWLDVAALGIGAFLVCGRLGCLAVGCCHGRVARRGVVYTDDHAAVGFPPHLVGTPLVPVQAMESAWVALVVAAGVVAVWQGAAPGAAAAWYVAGYGLGRCLLELVRGDGVRPMWLGASEAQWTSLALGAAVAVTHSGLALTGAAVGIAVVVVGTVVTSGAGRRPRARVLGARHIEEVAHAVRTAAALPSATAPAVVRTSLGIGVSSAGVLPGRTGVRHVALSAPAPLHDTVADLADVVARMVGRDHAVQIVAGEHGVRHLLLTKTTV